VVGWKDAQQVLVTSDTGRPFARELHLHAIPIDGTPASPLNLGPAMFVSFGAGGGCVLGRNAVDPARWKRYRGGTAGEILIDPDGKGKFRRLVSLPGNLASPMWLGDRIFFLSDHDGMGNLYSCLTSGEDLRRHTNHQDFYVRFPSTDGRRIVYHAGGDLHIFDPAAKISRRINVVYHSPRTQLFRKFVDGGRQLEEAELNPRGHILALVCRGKPLTMGNWEGPVLQHGEPDGVRYRLARWLNDGTRFVVISDIQGEETIEIHDTVKNRLPTRLPTLSIGRALEMKVSPVADMVALSNHRNELIVVDLKARKSTVLDSSGFALIRGFDWSPDGAWLAFSCAVSRHTSAVKIVDVKKRKSVQVTKAVLQDASPVFDPEGKYLYFLSYREFDPVYDNLHFDLGFPKGVKPYLLILAKDTPTPLILVPKPTDDAKEAKDSKDAASKQATNSTNGENSTNGTHSTHSTNCEIGASGAKGLKGCNDAKRPPAPVKIDFDGIELRLLALPVPEAKYQDIAAIKGKVFFSQVPVSGALNHSWLSTEPTVTATLEMFDLETLKCETVATKISGFKLSPDRKSLMLQIGKRLRIIKAGEKADENEAKEPPSRKSGWIALDRVKLSILQQAEWRQIYREAWRLQRDQFWSQDMSKVDWNAAYERYYHLLGRVATRGEFSDLLWEMQGELGTSHACEFGGDYRPEPSYSVGFLGADFTWNAATRSWKIVSILEGDPWNGKKTSPYEPTGAQRESGRHAPGNRRKAADGIHAAGFASGSHGQPGGFRHHRRPERKKPAESPGHRSS